MPVIALEELLSSAPYHILLEVFEVALAIAYKSRTQEEFAEMMGIATRLATRAAVLEPQRSTVDILAAEACVKNAVVRSVIARRSHDVGEA